MIATVTNHISRGVTNIDDVSIKNNWYGSPFNMPVKNYMTGSFVRYEGAWTYDTETTAYNLAGWVPGWEMCNGCAIFDFENDSGSPYTIDTDLTVKWVDTDGSTVMYYIANAVNYYYANLPDGYYTEVWWGGNIGVADWEIESNDTYYFKASASGTPNVGEVSTSVTVTNCPSTTQLAANKAGYIWVEGNDLCYINANRWKHTMIGVDVDSNPGVSKAGYIWIDTSNDLHWVGADGHNYKAQWKVKQFASFYGNGATGSVSGETPGYFWADNEFGWSHLSYIGNDGWKYLTGSGNNPLP